MRKMRREMKKKRKARAQLIDMPALTPVERVDEEGDGEKVAEVGEREVDFVVVVVVVEVEVEVDVAAVVL